MKFAVGVDVGVKKGCHAVGLDADAKVVAHERIADPAALGPLLQTWDADVVAIDSPPPGHRPASGPAPVNVPCSASASTASSRLMRRAATGTRSISG